MTGEMLSQDEINALLGGLLSTENSEPEPTDVLTPEEIDALGEIGNISMGTAATTLFALLNHKVMITTPYVEILSLEEFRSQITEDLIAISVGYTEGLIGTNLLILNEHDVKIIADLMMGGPGVASEEPISELHLSAIAEAMNQMIGSSSTSLSQMFSKKIDISPPEAIQMTYTQEELIKTLGGAGPVVKISFRMQVEENIIDSQLMQVLPISFAKDLVGNLYSGSMQKPEESVPIETLSANFDNHTQSQEMTQMVAPMNEPSPYTEPMNYSPNYGQPVGQMEETRTPSPMMRDIEVQRPQFPSFDTPQEVYPKGNMDILMDVSLEVSVELGRTRKKIKEILEFGPGSVIELDHLVGEPVDVLANGKFIAKGEVVVIDENFGIRITDIINPESRI